jgi:hypothetical protein
MLSDTRRGSKQETPLGSELLPFAFKRPNLGGREPPAAGVIRVQEVGVGVEPPRLNLRNRAGACGLGLARAVGGGSGLELDEPLLGPGLSGATGPAGGEAGPSSLNRRDVRAHERAHARM